MPSGCRRASRCTAMSRSVAGSMVDRVSSRTQAAQDSLVLISREPCSNWRQWDAQRTRRGRPLAGGPYTEGTKMHPDTTLLLVGDKDETLGKAKALGLHVLLLQQPEKCTEEQRGLADVIRIVDYTDLAALELVARELHESVGFTAAVSVTEPGLEGAGRINDLFGLGGTRFAVARRVANKWALRPHPAPPRPATVDPAPLPDPPRIY